LRRRWRRRTGWPDLMARDGDSTPDWLAAAAVATAGGAHRRARQFRPGGSLRSLPDRLGDGTPRGLAPALAGLAGSGAARRPGLPGARRLAVGPQPRRGRVPGGRAGGGCAHGRLRERHGRAASAGGRDRAAAPRLDPSARWRRPRASSARPPPSPA
jgi:hypothetical protein